MAPEVAPRNMDLSGTDIASDVPRALTNTSNTSSTKFVEPNDFRLVDSQSRDLRHTGGAPNTDIPMADAGDMNEDPPSNSDDEKSEDDNEVQTKVPKTSERRRAQNVQFSAWLSQRAEKVTKEQVKSVLQNANEDILTVRQLMAKQESNVIITNPRDYQVELFEKAKKQNIIAVLDTGSGKTLIAVLLLRNILDQELEDRALGKKPKISFFLVDSVTLVFQQFAVLECNLDHKIERFCGEMGCELWAKSVWEKHFKENMVIVCTAEILYQCLMHSFVALDQINLLIFDEAHHAKKNHAYARFDHISFGLKLGLIRIESSRISTYPRWTLANDQRYLA